MNKKNVKVKLEKENAEALRSSIDQISNDVVKTAVDKIYGGKTTQVAGEETTEPWLKAHGDVTWTKGAENEL